MVKPAASIEHSEIRHYDTHAQHKTRRDVIPSSRIPRQDIVLRSVEPVLKARGGSLGTIVDVGCGIAPAAVYMKGLYGKYIGIDFSAGMIEAGREFTKGLPNVELRVANIKEPDLPDGVADVVYMDGALHHMTDLPDVMRSLKGLAKPDAWFLAREPQRGNPLIQAARWIRMKVDASYSSDQRFFAGGELIDVMREAGMRDPHVRYQGFLTPPFAQVVLQPQWLFAPMAQLAVALEGPVERLMVGPLGRMSWNLTVYARFPDQA